MAREVTVEAVEEVLARYGIVDPRATDHCLLYHDGVDPCEAMARWHEINGLNTPAARLAELLQGRSGDASRLLAEGGLSWKRLATLHKNLAKLVRVTADLLKRKSPLAKRSREGLLWLIDGLAFFYELAHGISPSRGVDENGKEFGDYMDLCDDIFELFDLGSTGTVRTILHYGVTPDGRAVREKWDFARYLD